MNRDLVIALTLTSAKRCVPRRLAPVSSPSSTANTRGHNSGNDSANSFARVPLFRVAHASGVLAIASRDRELFFRSVPLTTCMIRKKGLFRRNAETRTPEACATQSFHTHTSKVPDPALLLRAWPIDQHLTRHAALQKPSNRSQTSARRQLLVARATTF